MAHLDQVIRQAGSQRFRPIVLTWLTTFEGLVPMDGRPEHAGAFVMPMAVSLAFGVLLATFITLFLVPVSYAILDDLQQFPRALSASLRAALRA